MTKDSQTIFWNQFENETHFSDDKKFPIGGPYIFRTFVTIEIIYRT